MNHKKLKYIFSIIILIFATVISIIEYTDIIPWKKSALITSPDVTTVTYLDVGQGDSTLIELKNGEVMLIDSGEREYAASISNTLNQKGIDRIDYLIATHPHSDHIGAMADIINDFEIGVFFMPDVHHTSKAFENMLAALEASNADVRIGKAGMIIFDKDSLKAEILSPVSEQYEELNDYSIVIRLECGKNSFLFMGDAEKLAENQITGNVKCNVLKLGHHGSSTSTGTKFLKRADPDYAVISCGAGNDYGHPHREITNLLKKQNIPYYRTDTDGNIVIICDGENINILNE